LRQVDWVRVAPFSEERAQCATSKHRCELRQRLLNGGEAPIEARGPGERARQHTSHNTGGVVEVPNCARNSVSAEARAIRTSTGRPVVIPLAWRLGDMDPARVYRESYAWTFSAPGDQIQRLREATTLLAQFPKATSAKAMTLTC
jgi:hypothetical protein